VDIVLIFDKELDYEAEKKIGGISGDIDYKYNVITIPLPYTMEELERNCVFYNELVNKGIYYDAA
jgi:hypothetical protein